MFISRLFCGFYIRKSTNFGTVLSYGKVPILKIGGNYWVSHLVSIAFRNTAREKYNSNA